MIFVTVGTNEARFDRLLEAVAELDVEETIVVQHGSSPVRPGNAQVHDFLPFDRMVELMQEARVVITHAGVGSIMVALAQGRRPIVVPRRKAFGEAVDDHQIDFGRRFAQAGLVTFLETPAEIESAVGGEHGAAAGGRSSALANDLRSWLDEAVHGLATALPTR
jgi:UDP-N-acetylglucosamine transferase subunit ALG13